MNGWNWFGWLAVFLLAAGCPAVPLHAQSGDAPYRWEGELTILEPVDVAGTRLPATHRLDLTVDREGRISGDISLLGPDGRSQLLSGSVSGRIGANRIELEAVLMPSGRMQASVEAPLRLSADLPRTIPENSPVEVKGGGTIAIVEKNCSQTILGVELGGSCPRVERRVRWRATGIVPPGAPSQDRNARINEDAAKRAWLGKFTLADPRINPNTELEKTGSVDFSRAKDGSLAGYAMVRIKGSRDYYSGALTGRMTTGRVQLRGMLAPSDAIPDPQLKELLSLGLELDADMKAASRSGDIVTIKGDGDVTIADPRCLEQVFSGLGAMFGADVDPAAGADHSGECPRVPLAVTWQASGGDPGLAASGDTGTPDGPGLSGDPGPADELIELALVMLAILGGMAGASLGAMISRLSAQNQAWWLGRLDPIAGRALDEEPPGLPWLSLTGAELNMDAATAARLHSRPDGSLDLEALREFFRISYGLPDGDRRPPGMDEDEWLASQHLLSLAVSKAAEINLLDSAGQSIGPDAFGEAGSDSGGNATARQAPMPAGHVAYDVDTHGERLAAMLKDGVSDGPHHQRLQDLMDRIARDGSLLPEELAFLEQEHAVLAAMVDARAEAFRNDPEAAARQKAAVDARRREADAAAEAADRGRKDEARTQADLDAVRRASARTDQDGINDRAYDLDKLYRDDGSLDPERVSQLKASLYRQLGRDVAAPDASLENTGVGDIVYEGLDQTITEASSSLIVRGGLGYLTGGVSEIGFQAHGGAHKLYDAVAEAADRGEDLTPGQVGKLWARHMIDENLPVNTLNALARARMREMAGEDPSIGAGELGMALLADVFSGKDVIDSGGGKLVNRFIDETMDAGSARALREAAGEAVQPLVNLAQKGKDAFNSAGTRLGFDMSGAPPGRLNPDDAVRRFKDVALTDTTRGIIRDVQGSGATRGADDAFGQGRAAGQAKVDDFNRATADLDAARSRGADPDEVAALQQKLRDTVAEVQGDKHAMNQLNRLPRTDGTPHPGIARFNSEMRDIYRQADEATIRRLAEQYRVRPADIRPVEITNLKGKPDPNLGTKPEAADHAGLASRKTADGSVPEGKGRGAKGELHAPRTKEAPVGKDAASMDRDLTMRVRSVENGVEVWRDIPSTTTARHYNEELYLAMTGKQPGPRGELNPSPGAKDSLHRPESIDFKDMHLNAREATGRVSEITDPDRFAKRMDQATTDRMHAEAYGGGKMDLDTATKDAFRGRDLRDVGAAARTMEYKVHHWMGEAERLHKAAADPAAGAADAAVYRSHAEAMREEAQRQLHKQFQNMVAVRTGAMQAVGNAPGASIPHSLSERVNVLGAVRRGELTPAQAEAVLNRMGSSTEQLAHQMSAYVEGLQNVRPTAPRQSPPSIVIKGWEDEFARPAEDPDARRR
jgi:hypothetical protein